jgi:DNA-binding Xre family transcriptional regulator
LEGRVLEQVLKAVQQIEEGEPNTSIAFHGLDHYRMVNELKGALWDRANGYRWRVPGSGVPPQALQPPAKATIPKSPPARQRMSATIHSPSAARKVEAYLATKGIGLTDFASTAGTTDRTLRSFRKTGNIRRSILAGIASAMSTSMENLLKP